MQDNILEVHMIKKTTFKIYYEDLRILSGCLMASRYIKINRAKKEDKVTDLTEGQTFQYNGT